MKKYSGQKIYDEMEKIPFLNRDISIRESESQALIKRSIVFLGDKTREYGEEAVLLPWISHCALSVEIFGYSVCKKSEYEDLVKKSKQKEISGDPYPARAYDISLLERKVRGKGRKRRDSSNKKTYFRFCIETFKYVCTINDTYGSKNRQSAFRYSINFT